MKTEKRDILFLTKRIILIFLISSLLVSVFLMIMLSEVDYNARIIYYEEERYIDYNIEKYYEVIEQEDCDYTSGCYCIKEGFWSGLIKEYCIRCRCQRTKMVPVEKTRIIKKEKIEILKCFFYKKIIKKCPNQLI